MCKRTVRLCPVIHERFLCSFHAALLLCREPVHAPKGVFNALTVPTGFIEFRLAEYVARRPIKEFRETLVILKEQSPPLLPLLRISKPRNWPRCCKV
jgi:hypothetical protein